MTVVSEMVANILDRWNPINPPAPVTNTRLPLVVMVTGFPEGALPVNDKQIIQTYISLDLYAADK